MNVLDFLKGNYDRHVAGSWTPISPNKPWRMSSWWGSSQSAAGIQVDSDSGLNSSAAFACTRALSETLASLPAVVYEGLEGDQRQRARQNPMWALLHDQPNPQMDTFTFYSLNAKRLVNRGNALSLIEFNGRGLPVALWPVHNSRWEARRRPSQANGSRWNPGDVYYRIWPDETERHFDVPAEEVLNIVGFDTENGIVAKGVISRAKNEIGLDIAEQEYAGSMFKNGALPLGLISHPWVDDEEQRDNLRADVNSMHTGRENWSRVGFLWDKDASWIPLNFNPKDIQAIESRSFTAKAICRYYSVPPAIVQIFDDYKFSTVEAMLKQFVMLGVRPLAVCFERAIKMQLLTGLVDSDLFLEFALEGLLRGDPKSQAETNAILRQWGAINADEWRQRDLNMNPLPSGAGAAYLAPLNYAPLEVVAGGGAAKPPAGRSQQPGNGKQQAAEQKAIKKAAKWDKAFVVALNRLTRSVRALKLEVHNNIPEQPTPSVTVQNDVHPAAVTVTAPHVAVQNDVHLPEMTAAAIESQHKDDVANVQYARMLVNEINGIKRIAEKGRDGFMDRVKEFYDKFTVALANAIAAAHPKAPRELSQKIATRACDESRKLLGQAIKTEPFADAISACLAEWPKRTLPIKENQ